MATETTAEALAALSRWVDEANSHRDAEAAAWGRFSKIGEEFGEVIAAFIGVTGQNPRKGATHSLADVTEELLDVAVAALGAVEHVTGNTGESMRLLDSKVARVLLRARTTEETA